MKIEELRIKERAKSVAKSLPTLIVIFGSLTTYVLSHTAISWKLGLLNFPILLYVLFFRMYDKDHDSIGLSLFTVLCSIFYLFVIFSILYVLMINMVTGGRDVSLIRFYPAILHIAVTLIIGIAISPLYFNSLTKKGTSFKEHKYIIYLATTSAAIGLSIGRVIADTFLFSIVCFFALFVLLILVISMNYYFILLKYLLRKS